MKSRDDELDDFKTRIDLTAVAAQEGYKIDRRATSRSSAVMKNEATGSKIVIAKALDGHSTYFSVHDPRDNGTVIDFLQRRRGLNLGQVRVACRNLIAKPPESPLEAFGGSVSLEPIHRDLAAVRASWEAAEPLPFGQHPYLNDSRGLSPRLLALPQFEDRIRCDRRGNALFRHFSLDGGVGGFEIKNAGFTGFAKHGQKSLWGSRISPADDRLAICETALDALSYAQLFGPRGLRVVSTAGALNPEQPGLLTRSIQKLPRGKVLIAVDNDEGGDLLAGIIRSAYGAADNPAVTLQEHRPPTRGQDWNDALRDAVASPYAPPTPK